MPGPSWAYIVIAWVAGLAAGPTVWWALFSDRAKGRRRCGGYRGCWYDMTGVPGLRCPECGRQAKSERVLHRARRRWGWGAVGAGLAIVAGLSAATPRVREYGWASLPPTWVILGLEDVVGRGRWAWVSAERAERFWRGEFSPAQAAAMVERQEWMIRMRAVWPAGLQPTATWTAAPIVLYDKRTSVQITPLKRDGTPDTSATEGVTPLSKRTTMSAPVQTTSDDSGVAFRVVATGEKPFEITIVKPIRRTATVDEAVAPVHDKTLDAAVCQQLRPRKAWVEGEGEWNWADSSDVGFDTDQPITLGITLDILYDGRRVGGASWWQRTMPTGRAASGMRGISPPIEGDMDRLRAANTDDPRWTVVVRGDGLAALDDINATRRWEGSFTMTLKEFLTPTGTRLSSQRLEKPADPPPATPSPSQPPSP